jgi:hypothetical protein
MRKALIKFMNPFEAGSKKAPKEKFKSPERRNDD